MADNSADRSNADDGDKMGRYHSDGRIPTLDVALIPPAGARYNYGDLWGTDELVYFSRYDGLMNFRITALGAYCLGSETAYQPPPVETKPVLSVLPNLEITAIDAELERGDCSVLLEFQADDPGALSGERTPGFDTILKVVQALGLKLHASPLQS